MHGVITLVCCRNILKIYLYLKVVFTKHAG